MFQPPRLDLPASCGGITNLACKAHAVRSAHARTGRAPWVRAVPVVGKWLPSDVEADCLRLRHLMDHPLKIRGAVGLARVLPSYQCVADQRPIQRGVTRVVNRRRTLVIIGVALVLILLASWLAFDHPLLRDRATSFPHPSALKTDMVPGPLLGAWPGRARAVWPTWRPNPHAGTVLTGPGMQAFLPTLRARILRAQSTMHARRRTGRVARAPRGGPLGPGVLALDQRHAHLQLAQRKRRPLVGTPM